MQVFVTTTPTDLELNISSLMSAQEVVQLHFLLLRAVQLPSYQPFNTLKPLHVRVRSQTPPPVLVLQARSLPDGRHGHFVEFLRAGAPRDAGFILFSQ